MSKRVIPRVGVSDAKRVSNHRDRRLLRRELTETHTYADTVNTRLTLASTSASNVKQILVIHC